jgi:hypothetical protein
MKGRLPHLRVWEGDRREFLASIVIQILGFISVSVMMAPRPRGTDRHPPYLSIIEDISRLRAHLIIAILSLFFAVNAYRDKQNVSGERVTILMWCVGLCLWIALLFSETLQIWRHLP